MLVALNAYLALFGSYFCQRAWAGCNFNFVPLSYSRAGASVDAMMGNASAVVRNFVFIIESLLSLGTVSCGRFLLRGCRLLILLRVFRGCIFRARLLLPCRLLVSLLILRR